MDFYLKKKQATSAQIQLHMLTINDQTMIWLSAYLVMYEIVTGKIPKTWR